MMTSDWLPIGECGPINMNRFGKPGTATERYACGPSTQASSSVQAALADDLHRADIGVRIEPCREHEQIQFVQCAVRW